uniref:Uncharacterized protein n=1 Tax=Anguilla anguilla TaxID=7936 RepID=A0A0E9WF63_ANGAN
MEYLDCVVSFSVYCYFVLKACSVISD